MRRSLLAIALFAPLVATAVPMELNHQGRLLDSSGVALDGPHDLTITLYDASAGGTELWSETQSTTLTGGHFSLRLGSDTSGNPLESDDFDPTEVFVGISVDGGAELTERLKLASVPYAIQAGSAASAATVAWDAVTGVPEDLSDGDDDSFSALVCNADQTLISDGSGWTCADGGAHTHDADELVSGILDAGRLPIGGGADEVAAGDHGHEASAISGTFSADQIPDLDAAKITSGSFDGSLISGDLSVADVTISGNLDLSGGTVDFGDNAIVAPNAITGDVHTIVIRATGNNDPGAKTRNIVVNGTDTAADSRGLVVTVIDRADGSVVSNKTYDTHGSGAASDQLVTDLDALDSSVAIVVASYDAWTASLTSAAKEALISAGASNLLRNLKGTCCSPNTSDGRSAYALAGIPGAGEGSGIEGHRPSVDGPIEMSLLLVDGNFVGAEQKSRCPAGWYNIGQSCMEYRGGGDNQSWAQTADRCATLGARMCSPYEMYVGIQRYGAAFDIGANLSHPHVDQLAVSNGQNWDNNIVMQGWGGPANAYGGWTQNDRNGNSRNICCVDRP